MNEEWIRWKPIDNLSAKYDIDAIYDDMDGFRILLTECRSENSQIYVVFKNSVDAYRSADETYRCQLISDLHKKYGSDFYGDWTFFKIRNSEYLQWISYQSCTISDHRELQHFSFLAANSVLDVINPSEPIIKIIK